MIISVRDVMARCARCGGSEFTPQSPGPLQPAMLMTCDGCGEQVSYRELLDRIGEEAIRRANESLAELKKKSRRPRKPRK